MPPDDRLPTAPGCTPPAAGVDRRGFLRQAAVLGVAASISGRVSSAQGVEVAPGPATWSPQDFELNEITIAALQDDLAAGRHTARSVVELYLSRIDALDRAGPVLRSVIEVNPDALRIADALDAERKAGRVRGPLHGVPVLVKDVVDTADRMHTTAGSLALMGSFATRDAFIAARLRAAGAIILGKTNLSEWSNARSTRATSGWSARGGLTKNPYVLDRTACGSSSGSAVAVAANLATVGIGAETDGSITCPASANSLVGVKPTVGLWSRSGLIPISYSQDTAGPMARTVTDAAVLLGALTGRDPRDPATEASQGNAHTDYTTFLDRRSLNGKRIGVLRRKYELDTSLSGVLDNAVRVMRSLGAEVVDDLEVPSFEEVQNPETMVLICEFKDAIAEYLATRGPEVPHRTLADLIRFNEQNADLELEWFGQEWFMASQETEGRETSAYRAALARCRELCRTQGLDRVLGEEQLDAVVGLAATPPFAADLILGDRAIVRNSSLSAVAGYPRVTLPAGFIHGLPVGVSFMGPAWGQGPLLGMAYAFEQEARVRRPPHFLPTAVADK